ncbi:acetate kinase [Nitrobacter vulgaris]|nr:acetate kinase [Nitrobacter vulgaris]
MADRVYAEGVRRYGFHGLSYEYIAKTLPHVAPEIANGRAIVVHLGSGASMCALKGGRSIESTMGFTAMIAQHTLSLLMERPSPNARHNNVS